MKTITINIAEGGFAICNDTNIGRAGEHNNTSLHIIINDSSMLECDYFRVWLGNKYSPKITMQDNGLEYLIPQAALIPPSTDFELCGYKMLEGEACLVVRSSALSFEISESAGCLPIYCGAHEPFEVLSLECGASANSAHAAMQQAEEYAQMAGEHYEASCETAERIEAAVKSIGDAPRVTEEIVERCETAAGKAEAAAEYLETAIGDIDAALDNIIAIQNELIGGEE